MGPKWCLVALNSSRVADRKTREIERLAQARAKSIESAFTEMSRAIAGPLAAVFGVNTFIGFIKGAIDAQDNLKDLSKSTAISIENLAGLSSAALKSGSDLESVAAAINKLSVNMGKDPEKYRAIGIAAKDVSGGVNFVEIGRFRNHCFRGA